MEVEILFLQVRDHGLHERVPAMIAAKSNLHGVLHMQ
jgi:hypothetical protein